ncbi:trichohyalin, partial [Trypanosoma theileri]
MMLFQPHHSIQRMDGIDIISKLFPHAYPGNSKDSGSDNNNNNARVSLAHMAAYTELMQTVTSSPSFCRVIQTSSLLLQLHLTSVVVNLWWLHGAHIQPCLFRDGCKDEWRPSLFLCLL